MIMRPVGLVYHTVRHMTLYFTLFIAAILTIALLAGAYQKFTSNRLLALGLGFLSLFPISYLVFVLLAVNFIGRAIGPGAQDFNLELPNDYYMHRLSVNRVFISPMGWNSSTPIIPEKVIKLGWNNQYVVAKQETLERRSPENPADTYMIPAGTFAFWILNTEIPKVYGPLNSQEFDKLKKDMGIQGIKLKEPRAYR